MTTDVTGFIACGCVADRVSLPGPPGPGTWIVKSNGHVVGAGDLGRPNRSGGVRSLEVRIGMRCGA
jgi:hypothetical protein